MRVRTRRRSTSSWVSPGPRVPTPPPSRERCVHWRVRRGSRYWSWASSTCILPSRLRARWAKMSRMSALRSMTFRLSSRSRLRCWAGESGSSKMTTSARASSARPRTSSTLPWPMNNAALIRRTVWPASPERGAWRGVVCGAARVGTGRGQGRAVVHDHLAAVVRELERASDDDRRAALDDRLVPPVRLRPGDDLDRALLVLEDERRVAIPLLAVPELEAVDDAAEANVWPWIRPAVALPVARRQLGPACAQRARRGIRELPEILCVAVERVAGDEEADRLALRTELLLGCPRRCARQRRRYAATRRLAEEADLPPGTLLGPRRRPAKHVLEAAEQACAVALERIEGAALDEAFDHASVHELAAYAQAKVVQ